MKVPYWLTRCVGEHEGWPLVFWVGAENPFTPAALEHAAVTGHTLAAVPIRDASIGVEVAYLMIEPDLFAQHPEAAVFGPGGLGSSLRRPGRPWSSGPLAPETFLAPCNPGDCPAVTCLAPHCLPSQRIGGGALG